MDICDRQRIRVSECWRFHIDKAGQAIFMQIKRQEPDATNKKRRTWMLVSVWAGGRSRSVEV